MKRLPVFLLALVAGSSLALAAPPTAYTVKVEAPAGEYTFTVSIYRDGSRERIESGVKGRGAPMAAIYDFAEHKVYWLDVEGPGSGACNIGKYTGSRAPVSQDPVTGSADTLAQMSGGKPRTVAGKDVVNGIPARIEVFAKGSVKPSPREPVPTRVWLSEADGTIVRIEGIEGNAKPATVMEVKELTFAKPPAALLTPPAICKMSNSVMDDTGRISSHAESTIEATAGGTADLATGKVESSVSVKQGGGTSATGKAPAKASNAKVTGVGVTAKAQPHDGPCGKALQVEGTIAVDGPATIWYRVFSSAPGAKFAGGQEGTIEVAGEGEAGFGMDVTFTSSRKGEIRVHAAVQKPDGTHGPVTISKPAAFDVACTAKPGGAK